MAGVASRHLHGLDGPVVVVPARVAALLCRDGGLDRWKGQVRGADAELDAVLVALTAASAAWRSRAASAVATECGILLDDAGTAGPPSEHVETRWSSRDAAAVVGVSERAIRSAAAGGRLRGERVGAAWTFDRDEVMHFKERRAMRRGAE